MEQGDFQLCGDIAGILHGTFSSHRQLSLHGAIQRKAFEETNQVRMVTF
jgi:hypothetical protein